MDSHVLSALDFEPSVLASIVCAVDHFRLMETGEKRWVGPRRPVLSITNDKSIRSLSLFFPTPCSYSLFFPLSSLSSFFSFFLLYNFVTRGAAAAAAAMIITHRCVFGNETRLADIDFVCTPFDDDSTNERTSVCLGEYSRCSLVTLLSF